ncbi:hypothetical protein B0G84_8629 [Paraburkholderia sp. BL8N3]|nr:hypothetical protein B0G84_8629 [Paraburkholderia sp. BL8N3]
MNFRSIAYIETAITVTTGVTGKRQGTTSLLRLDDLLRI